MAETAFAGPAGSASTRGIMREVLDMDAAGAPWHDRIVNATAGARDHLITQARVALNSRAAQFARRQLGWFRRLLADLGLINIAGYTVTTIEGRRGLRAVLRFGFRVLRLPFRLVGIPVGFVLRHTGRAGRWLRGNSLVVFCIARDKAVAAYDAAEAWLEAHDNHWAVRAARSTFHWRIMSRLLDRFAPRWFPMWARFVVKLTVPTLSYRRGADLVGKNVLSSAAEGVLDGLEHATTSMMHDTLAAIGEELPVTRIQLRDGTGRLVSAESIMIGEDTYVRLSGEKQFTKGATPSGYEQVTLTEVAAEVVAAGNGTPPEPRPNRESRREAARHRNQ